MNFRIVKVIICFRKKAILFCPHFQSLEIINYTTYLFSKTGEKTTVFRDYCNALMNWDLRDKVDSGIGLPMVNVLESTLEWT
jgi:hypothetical protein